MGYVPLDAAVVSAELAQLGLIPTGAPLLAPLFDDRRRDQVIAQAHQLTRLLAAVGAEVLVIVDWALEERGATAGRSAAAPRMNKGALAGYAQIYNDIGAIARRNGLKAVAHPHAGTYLEFEDEIDALLAATDPELVGLCVDTGHVAYAGIDPADLVARYADRLWYVNFKDLAGDVHAEVLENRIDFLTAVDLGVFAAIGEGNVDFEKFAKALRRTGYSGQGCVEQDRDVKTVYLALDDARNSLNLLRALGM